MLTQAPAAAQHLFRVAETGDIGFTASVWLKGGPVYSAELIRADVDHRSQH